MQTKKRGEAQVTDKEKRSKDDPEDSLRNYRVMRLCWTLL
jgi:hypothetical protein